MSSLEIKKKKKIHNSGETKINLFRQSVYLLQRFDGSFTHFQADQCFSVNPQKSTSLSM